ncbi:hypothetical protein JW906_13185 [bacterium]|nr:hypothetical protein [bacterium]
MRKSACLLLMGCLAGTAAGQEELISYRRDAQISTGFSYQVFELGDRNFLTQVAFPTSVMIPLQSWLQVSVLNTPAWTRWEDRGRKHTLSGVSDTWIQANAVLLQERLLVHAGVGIPTGSTRLDSMQFALTKTLSQNFLRMALPVYGQRFCVSAGAITAFNLAEHSVLGIGVQHIRKAAYHPVRFVQNLQGGGRYILERQYDPGDETSIHAGIDHQAGDNTKFMLDCMATLYQRDLLDGGDTYASGGRIMIDAGVFHRIRDQYLYGHVVYRQKGKNEILQGLKLEEETLNTNQSQLEIDVVYKMIQLTNGSILLLGDSRSYGENELGSGKVTLYGGGVGANLQFGDDGEILFRMKFLAGSRESLDVRYNVRGFEVVMNIRAGL